MGNGYAICFNEWALDPEIKSELGLLLIISSFTAEKGFCFASNKHFAEMFKIDEVSVSRKIKKLEQKKYITIEYEKRGCEVISRKIRLTKMLIDDQQKDQSTINKNVKGNIISNNNKTPECTNVHSSPEGDERETGEETEEKAFEEFWEHYTPVRTRDGGFVAKGNKKACKKKYIKILREGEDHGSIMQHLAEYLTYCRENNVKSCGAEVYLNQGRYEWDYNSDQSIGARERAGSHGERRVSIVDIAREFAWEGEDRDGNSVHEVWG